jgi:starch synthase
LSNVLIIAAENDALPRGKVGGIGDVIRDIPIYLAEAKQNVSVIIPSYGFQHNFDYAEQILSFSVPFAGKSEIVTLYKLHIDGCEGVTQYVLDHYIFNNAGIGEIYCDDGADRPFASDATKFAFFSTAVCQLLITAWQNQFDILHLHDWHTAFVALHRAMNPQYSSLKNIRCIYTVHNLALQGTRPFEGDISSFKHWFPSLHIDRSRITDPNYHNCFNPARTGINLCDAVHVVSENYATEVVRPSNVDTGFIGGEGLEHDLQNAARENRLFGILNGCQYPEEVKGDDKKLPTNVFLKGIAKVVLNWSAKQSVLKSVHFIASARLALWQENSTTGPLITSIGRLTSQKVKLLTIKHMGASTLSHLLFNLDDVKGRMIILGSGDPTFEHEMTQIMAKHENFIFLNGYDDKISQTLYKQGDLFLMPSSFEPCGISQMLSMRAGQPCIVNEIGGLKDTVKHLESGFTFSGDNEYQQLMSLFSVFSDALIMFKQDKKSWNKIAKTAKSKRFTWQQSIEKYLTQLYKQG